MTKRYTFEEIDNLVRIYKTAKIAEEKTTTLQELLAAFEGYITKFTNFFIYGNFGRKDKDIQALIRIFGSGGEDGGGSAPVIKKILESYTWEDIQLELQMIFIKCLDKYKARKKGPSFVGYLYQYFKYMVVRWLTLKSREMLNTPYIVPGGENDFQFDKIVKNESVVEKMFRNFCFIDTDKITNLDKYIFWLFTEMRYKEREIIEILGLERRGMRNTVNRSRKRVHKYLRSEY